MTFLPSPLPLRMNIFSKVIPNTITWDQPDEMFLVGNAQPADGRGPLPFVQPFEFSGNLLVDGTVNHATLSVKSADVAAARPAFVDRRLVTLTMDVDGVLRPLLVQLTYP